MSRTYRLYRLDGAGKIVAAEWFEAADDDKARQHALENDRALIREVWDRTRLVARIEAGGARTP